MSIERLSIEKLLQNAEQGDIPAMLLLGEYCLKEGSGEGYYRALEWYQKAADLGSSVGAHGVALICTTLAPMFMDEDNFNSAFELWNLGTVYATKAIPEEAERQEEFNDALKMCQESLYGRALCWHFADKFENAINDLNMIGDNSPRTNMLLAVCKIRSQHLQHLEEANNIQQLFLSVFDLKEEYVSENVVGKASKAEQMVCAIGACLFADTIIAAHIEVAEAIVERTYIALSDSAAKDFVLNYYSPD